MIDFPKIKGCEFHNKKVKRIEDAFGNVRWSAVRNAKVTFKSKCEGINGSTASITVTSAQPFAPDPGKPGNTTTSWTFEVWEEPNCTIEIPYGSTIECTVSDTKASNRCYINLNGTDVVNGPGTYLYTVDGDVTVHVTDRYSKGEYGIIAICEAGYAIVTTSGYTYGSDDYGASAYIDSTMIGGDTNEKQVSVVPIGTVIKCTAYYGKSSSGTITLNGTVVAQTTTAGNAVTYDHIVNGNADIVLAGGAIDSLGHNWGTITITDL